MYIGALSLETTRCSRGKGRGAAWKLRTIEPPEKSGREEPGLAERPNFARPAVARATVQADTGYGTISTATSFRQLVSSSMTIGSTGTGETPNSPATHARRMS
jgi:hypothetical protein